ncbi:hypothetical protein [Streptomyces laurentii]|uniref:hypothetical protein n=1 Tax=Streptomyces laurentii TaxID=39478 RepID=UPI0033DC3ED3
MTLHDELRLLPWSDSNGKPCFLSTDTAGGPLSRLADRTESAQLDSGAALLEQAVEVLANAKAEPKELHILARDLTNALRDALRIAVSRGHRLPEPTVTASGGGEGPQLPAAAFG